MSTYWFSPWKCKYKTQLSFASFIVLVSLSSLQISASIFRVYWIMRLVGCTLIVIYVSGQQVLKTCLILRGRLVFSALLLISWLVYVLMLCNSERAPLSERFRTSNRSSFAMHSTYARTLASWNREERALKFSHCLRSASVIELGVTHLACVHSRYLSACHDVPFCYAHTQLGQAQLKVHLRRWMT